MPRNAEGVVTIDQPPTPFVPEIPHAKIRFDNVAIPNEDVLEGDAYLTVLKPFRTVEDLHVHVAALAYLIGAARRFDWPQTFIEQATSTLLATVSLCEHPPLSPATHIATAGVIDATKALVTETEALWPKADDEEAERFRRDKPLLKVAGKARALRRQRAWESLARPL